MNKLFPVLGALASATLFFVAAVLVVFNSPQTTIVSSLISRSSWLESGLSHGSPAPLPELNRSQIRQIPGNSTEVSDADGATRGCPEMPFDLGGKKPIKASIAVKDVERELVGVRAGGSWWPPHCVPKLRLAIIVAFRNREPMLGPFLYRMHPFLQRQLLNYTVYLVEQTPEGSFNQAKLYNVGFVRARSEGPWDCYVFHDVDCLPENDRNLYFCTEQPRHLGVSRSKGGYRFSRKYLGCANALTRWQVERVNGWSNRYFGWGAEDDDMHRRILAAGMSVIRMDPEVATYTTLRHPQATRNPDKRAILRQAQKNYKFDGLNTLNYSLVLTARRPLYTLLLVRV
ncbi:beta-1,4-galactosyltransferase 4-like [Penaeus japonicus]|uniref:beta-1,4-galactosyltransferase 4-like n=1 Tax=Penaeus japonicus TaxID=27405 RepID=UPI001C715A83|nr:beta-1,4-galactosyltransferase 4-like [Penaeus japonicus]